MRTINRQGLRELRDQVRARARLKGRVWKEYKRRRKARPGSAIQSQWFRRLVWPLMPCLVAFGLAGRMGADGVLVLLALYCSGTIFLRANLLGSNLYVSSERYVAMHYPVSDTAFFWWQARAWLVSQWGVLAVSAGVYGIAAAATKGGAPLWIAAAAAALLQTGVVAGFALGWVRWPSRIRFQVGLAFYALMGAVLWFPERTLAVMGKLVLALPAEWINALFSATMRGSIMSFAALLGSSVVAVAADVYLVRGLAKTYPRGELQVVERHSAEQAFEEETDSQQSATNGQSLGYDFAASREKFAALRNRPRVESQLAEGTLGWLPDHWTSRLALRWLTEREKHVANFLVGGADDGWKNRWKWALRLAAAGVVVSAVPLPIPLWMPMGLFGLGATASAPLLGGKWPGLTAGQFGFGRFQPCAGYPAGYLEASKVMMKWNVARMVGFVPVALLGGVAIGWRCFSEPLDGALVASQIVVLAVVLQPYFCAFQHSSGTNDTKKWSATAIWLTCAFLLNVLMLLPAVIAFFALRGHVLAWAICIPVLFLLSFSMWRIYGYFYNRGRIDLQSGTA